ITLARRGLDLLEQGDPARAAETLQQALEAGDDTLEPAATATTRYNLALAQSRAGDLATAADTWRDLETLDLDPALRARARFNRGHTLFTEAEKLAETDAAAAIDHY